MFRKPVSRPGPSASAVMDSDKAAEFVQAVTLLTSVMKEPWAQQLISNMNLELPTVEMQNALRGGPAPSRPAATAAPVPEQPAMSTLAPAALKESHEKAEKEEPQKVEPSHLPVGGTTNVPDPDATTVLYPQPVNSGDGEKSADAVQPPPPKVPEPNSSTHRAAHARLVRRMNSEGASFPHMSKLWAGSRQERVKSAFRVLSWGLDKLGQFI